MNVYEWFSTFYPLPLDVHSSSAQRQSSASYESAPGHSSALATSSSHPPAPPTVQTGLSSALTTPSFPPSAPPTVPAVSQTTFDLDHTSHSRTAELGLTGDVQSHDSHMTHFPVLPTPPTPYAPPHRYPSSSMYERQLGRPNLPTVQDKQSGRLNPPIQDKGTRMKGTSSGMRLAHENFVSGMRPKHKDSGSGSGSSVGEVGSNQAGLSTDERVAAYLTGEGAGRSKEVQTGEKRESTCGDKPAKPRTKRRKRI